MPCYPITHLVVGPTYSIVATGPHLHVLDSQSGEILSSADTGSPIRVLAVDNEFTHIVTTADNKKLVVRKRDGLEVLSTRELAKRATTITFDPSNSILVSDKFGDVFRFPLTPDPSEPDEKKRSSGELLLGHVSIVTALQLSKDGNYVVTGDRDEHVRVSWYPEGYMIERYLFGHRKFVSALCIPPSEPSCLISGGGDPELFIWDWGAGTLKGTLPIDSVVRPFMHVKANKRQYQQGGEGKKKPSGSKRKGEQVAERDGQEQEEGVDAVGDGDGPAEEDSQMAGRSIGEVQGPDDPEIVLVVRKISCMSVDEESIVLFSLTGCSALFYLPLSSMLSGPEHIKSLNFGKPVIDFFVDGRRVWVSTDTNWAGSSDGVDVRLAELEGNLLVAKFEDGSPLLAGMGKCIHEGSASSLAGLELYTDLILMPKYADEGPPDDANLPPEKIGPKAEGRMKTKARLVQIQNETEKGVAKRQKTDSDE